MTRPTGLGEYTDEELIAEVSARGIFRDMIREANPMTPKSDTMTFAQRPYMKACDDFESNLLKLLGEKRWNGRR